MTARAAPKVVPLRSRAPAGAVPVPSAVDHQAAQAELNDRLFPHYILGRQLALEEIVHELITQSPPDVRARIAERLSLDANQAMQRLTAGIDDPKEDAATCGYVCTLLQQGF